MVARLNEITSVTREEAAAFLSRDNAYEVWTSEELVYFFWKYEE
jgi:hypothetical protein